MIMNDKREREKNIKAKEYQESLKKNEDDLKRLCQDRKNAMDRKIEEKQYMQKNLDKQVKRNETKMHAERLQTANDIKNSKGITFSPNTNVATHSCSTCLTSYPKKMLGPNIFQQTFTKYLKGGK